MNILLTSAGRRGYLVQYFKDAVEGDGEVHVSNSCDLSPAFAYADRQVVSPLIREDSYIPFLLDYCTKYRIDALIPLYDIDLPVLATNKERFKSIGTTVIVSESDTIKICNDKWLTHNFLIEYDFNSPKTYISTEEAHSDIQNNELQYPLVVKPRCGMGSIGLFTAQNQEELRFYFEKLTRDTTEGVIIQEKLIGQEYGLDVINNLKGEHQNTVCKIKYTMRAGETDCAETVNTEMLKILGKELSAKLKHVGNLDVDVFVDAEKAYILEMNPRFGGGYPFSHMAGVNLPKAIVQWLKNEPLTSDLLKEKYGVRSHKDIGMIFLDTLKKDV